MKTRGIKNPLKQYPIEIIYNRVNYIRLNQGYDEITQHTDDSNFTSEKCHKKIRKSGNRVRQTKYPQKNQKDRISPCDNLEILLSWKREIKIKPAETSNLHSIVVKSVCQTDLSQCGFGIQGIFMNISWYHQETNPTGVTIQEFRSLSIPQKVLSNGIVFIWTQKQSLSDIIEAMELKGFNYIENFVIINLKSSVAYKMLHKTGDVEQVVLENLSLLQDKVQVKDLKDNKFSRYLSNAKRTLLMFRKIDKTQLELRHQRTSDVLFDLVDDECTLSQKTKEYIYQMIETLLPKADNYKLMELWANTSHPRAGWVSVSEKKKNVKK